MLRLGATGHNGAEALVMLGRWEEAETVLRAVDGLVVTSCAGGWVLDALLDLRRGNLDSVEAGLARYTPTSPQGHAFAAAVRAELAVERDDIDGCLALVDHALAETTGTDFRFDAIRAHAIGLRAIADRAVRDRPARTAAPTEPSKDHQIAQSMLAEVERLQRAATPEHGDASPMITTTVALCRAETARVDGDDPAPWAQAADEFGLVGDRYQRAYCRFREAEARLAHRGDRKAATVALVEAWRSACDLGARRVVERCERLAGRANIRLDDLRAHGASPKARVAADLGLTSREVEVLELLAENRTDGEIADELSSRRRPPAFTCRTSCASSTCPTAAAPAGWAATPGWASRHRRSDREPSAPSPAGASSCIAGRRPSTTAGSPLCSRAAPNFDMNWIDANLRFMSLCST